MRKEILWLVFILYAAVSAFPQKPDHFGPFRVVCLNPSTPVKDQYKTNTCWSFSVVSFLESELLRKLKDTFDLSEMYFVRNVYEKKAEKYFRMHGTISLSGGGVLNDVMDAVPAVGVVPEQAYPAGRTGGSLQDHTLLDKTVKSFMETLVNDQVAFTDTAWKGRFSALLDDWLGEVPDHFSWKGHYFTPLAFRDSLGIEPSHYIVLTSFLHHPWYSEFPVEVPDNWNWASAWNVPLDELEQTVRHALSYGYTIAWAADISEPGFDWKNGMAYLSGEPVPAYAGQSAGAQDESCDKISLPSQEPFVNQLFRQKEFDRYATTDDHAMHIIGMAEDSTGRVWYIAKNSWGTRGTKFNGYLLVSGPYFRAKTISILMPKEAMLDELKRKLHLTK
jgi:bleomycin hydrolase